MSSYSTAGYLATPSRPWLTWSLMVMAVVAHQAPADTVKVLGDIARDSAQRCRAHATVGACDDALRWSPSDPTLLAAMGDALLRVRRPADALRVYQRAAALAPGIPGIEEKIQTARRLSAKARSKRTHRDASNAAPAGRRYSNSDPDTQTH